MRQFLNVCAEKRKEERGGALLIRLEDRRMREAGADVTNMWYAGYHIGTREDYFTKFAFFATITVWYGTLDGGRLPS